MRGQSRSRSQSRYQRSVRSLGQGSSPAPDVRTYTRKYRREGRACSLDEEVIEGLRANFVGECTEVGMYLAMSRQADREGYPEVAEAYKRIAFEEAEHAAKFAELLGEVVVADTKRNLEMRVEAEYGATEGKLKIAKRAKELGLDAIHDTVHEMCKDEARHGKAFLGLLERHFGKVN